MRLWRCWNNIQVVCLVVVSWTSRWRMTGQGKIKSSTISKTNSMERYFPSRINYPPLSCSESTALSIDRRSIVFHSRNYTCVFCGNQNLSPSRDLITALGCWCGSGSLSIRSGILKLWFVQLLGIFSILALIWVRARNFWWYSITISGNNVRVCSSRICDSAQKS